MSDLSEIMRVQESAVPRLLSQPGVTGVAVGYREKDGKLTDEIVIRVYVQDKRPLPEVPAELRIPSEIDGFKTDVIQKDQDVPCALNEYIRPLACGLQIQRIFSGGGDGKGTIGCFVADRLPDNIRRQVSQPGFSYSQHVYLLSASHVLNPTESTVDELVHQPVAVAYTNRVAETLKDRCVWSGAVDAGLARLDNTVEWKNDVYSVGTIDGIRRVALGDTVWKQGITTGLTSRKVDGINYFGNVDGVGSFGPAFSVTHNLLSNPFANKGDSGSLAYVWDDNPQGGKLLRAVGLMASVSNTNCTMCYLDTVFQRLKIEFPLTKKGKGTNLYSNGPLSPYPAYSYSEQYQTLDAHNREREIYPSVGLLQWSDGLAEYAQGLAQQLAATGYDEMKNSGVWIVTADDQVCRLLSDIERMPGRVRQVSVGTDGKVWGLDRDDNLVSWTGTHWLPGIPAKLKQISVRTSQEVWGVIAANQVYRSNASSTGWNWESMGNFRYVSVGRDGTVWAINGSGEPFRRDGAAWTPMPTAAQFGFLERLTVTDAQHVVAMANTGEYLQWTGTGWQALSQWGGCLDAVLAADGSVWGLYPQLVRMSKRMPAGYQGYQFEVPLTESIPPFKQFAVGPAGLPMQSGPGSEARDPIPSPYLANVRGKYAVDTRSNPVRRGEWLGLAIYRAPGQRALGADAVQAWISEKQWYDHEHDQGLEPVLSHGFRQVIWKDTQFVGCGKAYGTSGDDHTYIVCSYYPAGNWAGQKPY